MSKLPSSFVIAVAVTLLTVVSSLPVVNALGSGSTIAISYGTATVCAIEAEQPVRSILCYRRGDASGVVRLQPNVSFTSIAGGRTTICAIPSDGYRLFCWNTQNSSYPVKRIYKNDTVLLRSLAIGDDQICVTTNSTPSVICWRGNPNIQLLENYKFNTISSGFGFACGITADDRRVRCWGSNPIGKTIEQEFGNMSMASLVAGSSHACGVSITGNIVCNGANESRQLNVPLNSGLEYASGLALAENYSCAIRQLNRRVVCWGQGGVFAVNESVSFESIVSGSNFTCGLNSSDLSVVCWGPGWVGSNSSTQLPLKPILPGPCVQFSCGSCSIYLDSNKLCSGSGNICKPCLNFAPPLPPPPLSPAAPTPSSPSKSLRRGLLGFAIVGSVGVFMGICTVIYCLWTGVCFGKKKVHNSVQPTITRGGSNGGATCNSSPPSRSLTIRRQTSRVMWRQRSGTSSKHADQAEEFTLSELAAATNNFSAENKIGSGSFGVVYRGKLSDGREVAIKRGETVKTKKFKEKETAFESELAFLSRLHHKHLVKLVGYCEERDEKLLVYEFMKNGALYDHLHDKNNVEKQSSLLNSWKMRIKIALDAARGIEYLHNYAVPPVIHRDIKSSNILLDETWTARVSDFGLSLMGPESSEMDFRLMKAAGTLGYIDPEYYGLNVLTAKSDVYGLGVVMLELLTGKRAIFKEDGNGETPVSLVDFAVHAIMEGELVTVLDQRVGPPEPKEAEAEAVELMAYTAMHCVNLEGKDRPTMTDIVANLERACALCSDDSHGSISSGSIEIVSE